MLSGATDPAGNLPTLADLEALPPGIQGELLEGTLHAMTRPRAPHQNAGARITGEQEPLTPVFCVVVELARGG